MLEEGKLVVLLSRGEDRLKEEEQKKDRYVGLTRRKKRK